MNRCLTLFACILALSAAQPSLQPAPVRATLGRIAAVVERFPTAPETAASVADIRRSAAWLGGRLMDDRTPAAYARSLERDLGLLESALEGGDGLRAGTLEYVARDLALKHDDCRKFGMGRLVKVEVRTVNSGGESSGWQVFYRWVPSRAVGEVRQMPFPSLSSPTSVELPPGAYALQAKRTVNGKELAGAEMPVPVGGTKTVAFQVPVP
jgi:hypothetical protein